MLLMIDNYDSFTYNLVQYFGDLGQACAVHRNDQITIEEISELKPHGIVISPGPSDPDHSGICLPAISFAAEKKIPLLGVCLGHQCIGQAFGGDVIRAPSPMHGKISDVSHEGKGVFENLPTPYPVARYHSLIVDKKSVPDCLVVTALTSDDLVMGLSHKTLPIHGIQFHPESIATSHGHDLLKNFTRLL
jgi:anthranilate synthase component 2